MDKRTAGNEELELQETFHIDIRSGIQKELFMNDIGITK